MSGLTRVKKGFRPGGLITPYKGGYTTLVEKITRWVKN